MLPHATSQQLGWITTLAEFLMLGAGVLMGHLVDTYGTRIVIAPFAVISVIALGLLSLCTEYWQVLLCQGVLFGIACSGTTLPSIVCVTQWFSTRKGLAIGLASSGSSIGGLFFPIMVTRLLDSQGFAATVRWSALVVGCGMAIGVLCCEGPFPPKKERDKAERMLSRDEFSNGSRKEAEIPATFSHTEPGEGGNNPAHRDRWEALRHNAGAWAAFCAGGFFCMLTLLVPYNYLPQTAAAGGMNAGLAQYTVAIANGGSTIGRVLPGFLSDHWGQFNVMIMVSATSALSMLAIWLPLAYHASEAGTLFFAAFYGFISGGYTSLLSPCVVSLVDERLEDLGMKFGIACGFISIGALVGIPLVGAVRDSTGEFGGLIALSGSLTAIGAVFMLVARVKKGGWKFQNIV
ncbi:hypothetical protein DL767_011318 [Monosporascus sp. MG133]|nr:hypothetical protein DL767_011318 [Monosporascus sp. MG133]